MKYSTNIAGTTPAEVFKTTSPGRDQLTTAENICTFYDSMPSTFIGVAVVATLVAYTLSRLINVLKA